MGGRRAGDHGVPEAWRHIAETEKTLLTWPTWRDPPPRSGPPRGGSRREDLYSAAADTIDLIAPLAEKNGLGLEGARLRIVAWAHRREADVTATLEVAGGRSFVTIARIDAWPSDPHANTLRKRLPRWRHVPPLIEGHHVHRFADNAALGAFAFEPARNLPVAMPVPGDLRSFRDFLRIVEAEFRIVGLTDIPPPDTWESLI